MGCHARLATPPAAVALAIGRAHRPDAPYRTDTPERPYRIGTPERERVVALLTEALGGGYLTSTEFDQRVGAAIQASTTRDLVPLTADLPPEWIAGMRRRERLARHAGAARLGVRLHVAAYLAGMALMVGIWLVVGSTTGHLYPWPIWPGLGWGLGVLSHAIPVRLATRRGRT